MKTKIMWRLGLSVIVLAWAVISLLPVSDTPFSEYIQTRATAKADEFASTVLAPANAKLALKTKDGKKAYTSLYVAIKDILAGDNQTGQIIDLYEYFPDINASDIKNLEKRNDVLMRELYRQSKGKLKKGLDLQGGVAFTLKIKESQLSKDDAFQSANNLNHALEVMSSRVNATGVSEPSIRVLGSGENQRIEIQMPGLNLADDPQAIDELSRPAKLEFRRVHKSIPRSKDLLPSEIPAGYELMTLENLDKKTGQIINSYLFVKRDSEASGNIVEKSYPTIDQMGQWEVLMKFVSGNVAGSKTFEQITQQIVEEEGPGNGRLAIVLDSKLVSAPSVNSVIKDSGSISGSFDQREATDLANVLNNPLDIGLERESLNEVSASLASDARTSSFNAAAIGASLVILFMLLYYRNSGIVAIATVGANVLILLGCLSSLGATLTLPGVAAIVLTVGMAVDANILIFERMREEIRNGKDLKTALLLGFEKAFSTIVDANVTTLITAAILYYYGEGSVKGFGITLGIGVATTIFCALVLSRGILELAVGLKLIKSTLTGNGILKNASYDLLKFAKPAFSTSFVILIIGVGVLVYEGDKSLGIDFTGGEKIEMEFTGETPSLGKVLSLSNSNTGEIQAFFQKDISSGSEKLILQTAIGKSNIVFEDLKSAFPENVFTVTQTENIGASVGKSITINAIKSVLLAMLGILLYVAFRFEIGFGVGAVVSTLHDIVMTISIYIVLGLVGIGSGQFSSPMVAALLMIVGYSINDTIVVFDRIREELSLNPFMTLKEVINLAINKTLSRTILTSLTTFLAALALFIFGMGIIKDFSLVFLIGIATGTFSSVFIATPIFFWWHKGNRKAVEEKETAPTYDWQDQ